MQELEMAFSFPFAVPISSISFFFFLYIFPSSSFPFLLPLILKFETDGVPPLSERSETPASASQSPSKELKGT
jgi:hypothetical protein